MIDTYITISVNRKSDIEQIQQRIIQNNIQFPVYILEYEHSYQINFTSDYEEWELDNAILQCFPDYEYTKDLERGRKEIRIQISRNQSEFSTDDWGRRIESPLNETKFLVKKSNSKPGKFSPRIKVLFESNEQIYYTNIVHGINKATNEKGFLLLNNFQSENNDTAEIIKDRLYKSPLEAFHSGYSKILELAETDFSLYLEKKKKDIKDVQKLPRKIIRDFVNACNKLDTKKILENLDEHLVFEMLKNRQTTISTKGVEEFKEFLSTSNQQLCGKNYKIRSSWDFSFQTITIGLKYLQSPTNQEVSNMQKYEQMKFVLDGNKIISIINEN
jgi:hypothetical protein